MLNHHKQNFKEVDKMTIKVNKQHEYHILENSKKPRKPTYEELKKDVRRR